MRLRMGGEDFYLRLTPGQYRALVPSTNCPGECRSLAIEPKRLFEGLATEADELTDEIYLTKELEHALRRFLVDPTKPALEHMLEVSPALVGPVEELQSLLRMRP
jgi:hypothetical protein